MPHVRGTSMSLRAARASLSLFLLSGLVAALALIVNGVQRPAGAHPGQGPTGVELMAPGPVPDVVLLPPSAPAPDPELPRHRSVAPGEIITLETGIAFVDPRTGEAESWELPLRDTEDRAFMLAFTVSPSGRFIAYPETLGLPALPPASAPNQPRWLLFDTWTQTQRDLPGRPLGGGRETFSPDERLLLVQGADSVILLRTADGTVERTIPVAEPIAWSPDSQTVRTIAGATGQPQWAPDGAWYLLGNRDVVEARAAADDRTLWQVRADLLPDGGKVTLGHGTNRYGLIAPDGSRVAILASTDIDVQDNRPQADRRVYVVDAHTGALLFWVQGARTCHGLWTASSSGLLVWGEQSGLWGSFLVAADGAHVDRVGPSALDLSPVDADILVEESFAEDGHLLRILSAADGSEQRAIRLGGASRGCSRAITSRSGSRTGGRSCTGPTCRWKAVCSATSTCRSWRCTRPNGIPARSVRASPGWASRAWSCGRGV